MSEVKVVITIETEIHENWLTKERQGDLAKYINSALSGHYHNSGGIGIFAKTIALKKMGSIRNLFVYKPITNDKEE